jgi:hypothetical protein
MHRWAERLLVSCVVLLWSDVGVVVHPISGIGLFHWVFRVVGGWRIGWLVADRPVSAEHALEQRHPRLLPRPPGGQVHDDFSGGVGAPGGTEINVRRMVPVDAFASVGSPVSVAAARVRLNVITAQTNRAALAQKCADGMCARAEFFSSAWTCSMIACRRWIRSASTVSISAGSVVAKNAWNRHTSNSCRWP